MDSLRGADIVARTLEALGVERVFALSGNHVMPVFDALIETGIGLVHARHEAACVHMADAWGRLTGRPGIALVTGGQGHTNAAAALYTALAAEAPLVLLSGHAPLEELGRGSFQEVAQADLARPVAKASWTAASTETLGTDIARAMRLACEGRPGPVHVSLPVDLLERRVRSDRPLIPEPGAARPVPGVPDPALVAAVLDRLTEARRPMILCGPASCDAGGRAAMALLEARTGVPVVGMESPRGVDDPSLGAFSAVLAEADLLALVGKPLDFTLRFGEAPAVAADCRFVLVDPDPGLLGRAAPGRLALAGVADPRPFLAALAQAGGPVAASAWGGRVRAALAFRPPAWAEARGGEGRVHPVALCRALDGFLARHPKSVLVCDGGEIGQWPQALVGESLVRAGRRLINGVSGTIGAAIPFAIAAKAFAIEALHPDAPVVAVMGDGSFGFHMAEFDTALRHGLPIIAVVGNDACWNAEHQIQLRRYGADRASYCDLLPTRYDRVVAALGGFGALVTDADDLPAALDAAHASGLPACLNVMIEGVAAPVVRGWPG